MTHPAAAGAASTGLTASFKVEAERRGGDGDGGELKRDGRPKKSQKAEANPREAEQAAAETPSEAEGQTESFREFNL